MISINSPEAEASRNSSSSQPTASAGVVDCDFCGRTVLREAAFERVQIVDGEQETAFLCASCEFGGD